MLSTKTYNYNNSSFYENTATFDRINLSSSQPIVLLDYLQTNYDNKLYIDSSFYTTNTKITDLAVSLTNECYMDCEVLAKFYTNRILMLTFTIRHILIQFLGMYQQFQKELIQYQGF